MPTNEDFAYLELSQEQLETAIGQALLQGQFGAKPVSAAEARAAARRWFQANLDRFSAAICGEQFITVYLFGPQQKERNALFVAVFDSIGRLSGIPVPIAALSAMILQYGVKQMCGVDKGVGNVPAVAG